VAHASISSPNPKVPLVAVTAIHRGQNILTLETLRGRTDGLRIRYSASSNRTNSELLAGENIGGTVYIFFADAELLADDQVDVFLDGSGPLITDNFAQWDFRGTAGGQTLFKEDGQYLGTYFGLGATLAQMEVKENATLCGALHGDDVKVKENATVIGLPSLETYLAFLGL